MKGASFPKPTLDPEPAAMLGDDRFAEGQAQPQPIALPREPSVQPGKALKNPREVLRGNTPAMIAYSDLQRCFVLSKGAGQNECRVGLGPGTWVMRRRKRSGIT